MIRVGDIKFGIGAAAVVGWNVAGFWCGWGALPGAMMWFALFLCAYVFVGLAGLVGSAALPPTDARRISQHARVGSPIETSD
ncbi:hypothetical protein B0G75_110202 [Paraburkholderia sp. BL18I3N2]|nr:hypothetical protein B0G75_110202 [Paraburkholderia sp. BL18I3N2]